MGAFTFSDEFTSPIPPARLFKALIVDAGTLLPKLVPQSIKSIECIQGNGGPGSILQTTFQDGSGFPVKQLMRRIEAEDTENFSSKTSSIEGEGHVNIEKVVTEIQFVPGPAGGSINKTKNTYHTKGGVTLTEEDVKEGKELYSTVYKAVEAYLLQNPDANV